MFDTVYTIESRPVKSACCGKDLCSFQTKALENLMDEYREGEVSRRVEHLRAATEKERGGSLFPILVPDGTFHIQPHPQYHRFYAYEWCADCDKATVQWFQFDEEGRLSRWEKPILEKE